MSDKKRLAKAEQGEATIGKFIDVAKEQFSQHGYSRTSTEEIVRLVGVTRGALYHHFGSKEGLFRAVVDAVQQDIAGRVRQAATAAAPDPWLQLTEGCQAYLTTCLDPQIQRIILIDAPAVLGWQTWREIDSLYAMQMLRESLLILSRRGRIRPAPVEALTHLLAGAMTEAALWIAQSENAEEALDEAVAGLEALLDGLKA
jgi:AcrR family transcriptional regulator